MSARLTKHIREAITKAALAHRFCDEVKSLIDAKADFGRAVYDDLYKKEDRQKMADLPAGWLPENDSFGIQFGASFSRVYFSGYTYGPLMRATDYKRSDKFRILSKHASGCAKVYDATHKLSATHEGLRSREADLKSAYDAAERQMTAALNAVTTVKRLIETWPEIAPFATKYETEAPYLPAIPTGQLNKILDLPVSEAA
ncbi:Nmad5 family putative nucleotide modification protein [Shinella sp. JR1-6]|uniref:Nmad5 family putative nucleotide modification protein n=1 Tax=Shinella sp. JR1-6 TaxID=2527671 RepID=UPI00102D3E78|nr:Nmad5 family putative nucleotide modification protein [Shinella sp. JR1-6]TAA49789.1 hypothetical protein EXZ48_33880 [Shinella sp. JR1-6]